MNRQNVKMSLEQYIGTCSCFVQAMMHCLFQNLSSKLAGVFFMMEPVIYAGSCLLAICLMAVIVTYVTCFK